MKVKTLKEYAAEVAALIKGEVVYTGPHSAIIAAGAREITLDGPEVRGWALYNQMVIDRLSAGQPVKNLQVGY